MRSSFEYSASFQFRGILALSDWSGLVREGLLKRQPKPWTATSGRLQQRRQAEDYDNGGRLTTTTAAAVPVAAARTGRLAQQAETDSPPGRGLWDGLPEPAPDGGLCPNPREELDRLARGEGAMRSESRGGVQVRVLIAGREQYEG